MNNEQKQPTIAVEPDAWATKTMCIGPQYGKIRYDKLPIQCTQPGYYTHEKLYSEKTVLGLMKAAYYDGYTEREKEIRETPNAPHEGRQAASSPGVPLDVVVGGQESALT